MTIIKVEGMSCAHCEKAVVDAVTGVSGVTSATASAVEKVVRIEGEGFDLAAIAAAIADAGFDVVA